MQDEQLVVDRHLVDACDAAAEGVVAHDHGVQKAASGFLICFLKDLLAQTALLCGHRDQFLVEKGDVQLFGQSFADLVAAAAILTGNRDNR